METKKPKVNKPQDAETLVVYIKKVTPGLHQLRQLIVAGQLVVKDELLHEDTPGIVMGKFKLALYKAKHG